MVGTIMIHGSKGKVMAPIGGGTFIEGQRRDILITSASEDEDLPLHIRQALVGLTFSTIFSSEQVKGAAPEGSRLAYATEVAEAMRKAGKAPMADELLAVLKEHDAKSEYHFIIFSSSEYELVQ